MSKARAKKIKVVLFDVDGVLTDGTIWLVPAPSGAQASQPAIMAAADKGGYAIASSSIIEAKGFHAHDGTGITLARLAGLKVGIITKRISETVALRARDLKVDYIFQGQANKTEALDKIASAEKVKDSEIAFVGDDIVDLPVMRRCGLAIAVLNARKEVLDEAHYVTRSKGGEGAARDAVEFILRSQGRLKEIVNAYLESRPMAQKAGRNLL
jgi:3-deoxy-D-manno-octulosonate 8-phosphate phosphatase (KDO 8-P phosphatase)